MDAREIALLGYGLVFYIIVYTAYLAYLCLSMSKETKLVRRYDKGTSRKKTSIIPVIIVIVGGMIGVALVYLYLKYA